ncbi:MAG TPA: hypothetical protein VHG72_21935 [Polyangia bacterium]|nr:hypothetical protein [Polyangia bacterium]
MPMTTLLSYPDFNGHRYSRTSSNWDVDNALRIEGLISAQVTRKLTPGKSWGHRAKPQARTRGKFEPDAKVKLYMEDYNLLMNYLVAKGQPFGFGPFEVSWQLTGTLFETTLGTTRWDILGVRITNEDISPTEDGDDKQVEVSLDLDVMDLLKDGFGVVNEQSPFASIGGV